MGNSLQVVLPSVDDWYSQLLESIGPTYHAIESGSLFRLFKVQVSSKKVLIKAYQHNAQLSTLDDVIVPSQIFFKILGKQSNKHFVPFSIQEHKNNVIFLSRPFLQTNLVKFISFKPTINEKKWIAYQILYLVSDLHQNGLFHGDLKPSNIFVQTDLSVVLADFAPFKPTSISPGMIQLYYHFFSGPDDFGCFLAPERFAFVARLVNLTYSDLFSVGCVIAYIFLNGKSLFDVSSLIAYSQGKDVEEILSQISSNKIQDLIRKLISRSPQDREFQFDTFFPPSFPFLYSSTQSINSFSEILSLSQKIDLDSRIILVPHCVQLASSFTTSTEYVSLISTIKELGCQLSEYHSFLRIFPFITSLLQANDSLIFSISIHCLIHFFTSLKSPCQFESIVSSYFGKSFPELINKISHTNFMSFVSSVPELCLQFIRLFPSSYVPILDSIKSLFSCSGTNVFLAFTTALKLISNKDSVQCFVCFSSYITSEMKSNIEEILINVISILISFLHFHSDSKIFIDLISSKFFPILTNVKTKGVSDAFFESLLEFIDFCCIKQVLSLPVLLSVVPSIWKTLYSPNAKIRSISKHIFSFFPDEIMSMSISPFLKASHSVTTASPQSFVKKLHFKPKDSLVKSSKNCLSSLFIHSHRVASSKITSLHSHENFFFVFHDQTHLSTIRFTEHSFFYALNDSLPDVSSSSFLDSNSIYIGYNSGYLGCYDILTQSQFFLSQTFGQPIRKITQYDPSTLQVMDDKLSLFDLRTKKYEFSFETKIPFLNDYSTKNFFSCLGFSSGFSLLFDYRMMSPVCLFKTPSVDKIHYFDKTQSFFVCGPSSAYFSIEGTRHDITSSSYYYYSFEHLNGIVLFEGTNTQFFDLNTKSLMMINDDSNIKIPLSPHFHQAPISSHCFSDKHIVTGDMVGFLNFWMIV